MKYLHLLRIHHWVKNLFILIPAFFASRLFEPALLLNGLMAFLGFSLVASAVYVFNDLNDMESDRLHPRKRTRPIAAGQVSVKAAIVPLLICLLGGLTLLLLTGMRPFLLGLGYVFLNILYSIWLKHTAILDVSLIALGFLLRVYVGGAATGTIVSDWLTVLTFILALVLGFSKRRGEFLSLSDKPSFRRSLEGYNQAFLDASILICSTVAIVAYLMYCFSADVLERSGHRPVYFTTIFVVLGLLRMIQLNFVHASTETPTRLLWEDRFLKVVVLGWLMSWGWLLYR